MSPATRLGATKAFVSLRSLCVLGFSFALLSAPQFGQEPNKHLTTEVEHFGSAEAKTVTRSSGLYPSEQPEVYWHDDSCRIDLLPLVSEGDKFKLRVSSSLGGETSIVHLPENYAQIRSILRIPDDKAIVIADISGTVNSFCIVDLKLREVTDQVAMYSPSVSPDRRFILYVNGFAPHGLYGESEYHLYDTSKTPRENTCGFRQNDPEHKDLDESYRGFQVYPLTESGGSCSGALPEGEDHQKVSDFVWSSDSGKVAFADAKNSVITLIVVELPSGARGLARTVAYPLVGTENVCDKECTNLNVRSLSWDGDAIRAKLAFTPEVGAVTEKTLEIPLARFAVPSR